MMMDVRISIVILFFMMPMAAVLTSVNDMDFPTRTKPPPPVSTFNDSDSPPRHHGLRTMPITVSIFNEADWSITFNNKSKILSWSIRHRSRMPVPPGGSPFNGSSWPNLHPKAKIRPRNWSWCSWTFGKMSKDMLLYCLHNIMHALTLNGGAYMASGECDKLFKYEAWNCTGGMYMKHHAYFTPDDRSREEAYLQAVRAAGMVYKVAKDCSTGELRQCNCGGGGGQRNMDMDEVFHCSIHHAVKTVDKFVTMEVASLNNAEQQMAKHNTQVGQKAVLQNCACTNVTIEEDGEQMCSCYLPPTFHHIAVGLLAKYHHQAHRVQSDNGSLVNYNNVTSGLIFLNDSQDPCQIQSPRGRPCLNDTNCRKICCNRGWEFVDETYVEECNCIEDDRLEDICQNCTIHISQHQCK